MKKIVSIVSLVVVPVFLFLGCAGDSDKKSGIESIDIFSVPSDPMSEEELNVLILAVKAVEGNQPTFSSLLNMTIDGSDTKATGPGSRDREEALANLNAQGQKNLDEIKNNCDLNDAARLETGKFEQAGDVQQIKLEQSILGENCPVDMKQENSYRNTLISGAISSGNMQAAVDLSIEYSFLAKTKQMVKHIGFKAVQFSILMKAFGSDSSGQTNGTTDIDGDMNITFQNDQTVVGKALGKVISSGGKTTGRVLLTLQAPKGSIHIGILLNDDESKVYINGKEMNPNEVKNLKFGLAL